MAHLLACKISLLVGLVCLVSMEVQAASGKNKFSPMAHDALSFLNSELSQKLASVDKKLDVEETKQLLEIMRRKSSQELFTKRRAADLIEVSNVNEGKCNRAKIEEIIALLYSTRAFPNVNSYLEYYKKKQVQVCRQLLKRADQLCEQTERDIREFLLAA